MGASRFGHKERMCYNAVLPLFCVRRRFNNADHEIGLDMNYIYIAMSAWREILARTFEGFSEQDNVSPDWLVNPATHRRLKIDKLYPEAGIAIRFVGLTAKGQGRQSDVELMDAEERDRIRTELCRLNGVQLVAVDPAEDIVKQMDGLISALSRASRQLAQSDRPAKEKSQRMPPLAAARDRAEELRRRLSRDTEQMAANLADSWRDREAGVSLELSAPATVPTAAPVNLVLSTGQRVRHTRFGEGVVTRIDGSGGSAMISILFDAAQERTFQADLLGNKIETV